MSCEVVSCIILTLILEVDLRLSFPLDFLYRLSSTSDYKTSVLHQIMWYIYAFFVITTHNPIQKSQNTYLDGDSHLDSDWSGSFYNRLPLVGADNVVNPASDNRCNTDPDAEANQQRLLIAGHDAAGSG